MKRPDLIVALLAVVSLGAISAAILRKVDHPISKVKPTYALLDSDSCRRGGEGGLRGCSTPLTGIKKARL